jgi:cell wall-associated NlpC family hydrolase
VPRRVPALLLLPLLALGACGAEDADGPSVAATPRAVASAVAVPTPRPALPVRDDAEARESFPVQDPERLTERPPAPGEIRVVPAVSAEDGIAEGAPSDAQIRRELEQMEEVLEDLDTSGATGSVPGRRARLNADGTATPPEGAPEAVRRIIAAGNEIAKFPYVYGGGHRSFVDTAYDCSGSVSYALRAAGLVERPMVSGEFARAGAPGPGKWVTIYANDGHMFMVVAGLRYDTSGRSGPRGSRWQTAMRSTKGLEVRHPPGL